MIITVLNQMYKCGCNRGMSAIEKTTLLPKLNAIIEWDLCEFPTKIEKVKKKIMVRNEEDTQDIEQEIEDEVVVEDREFLGSDPELKPGNCFLFKGQVIAVDSIDRLVLIVSETGRGALNRIWEEDIKTELDLKFNNYETNDISWNVSEDLNNDIKEFDGDYKVPYNIYRIWKDHFVEGRGFLKTGLAIKVNMDSDNFIWPIDLLLMDWSVKYKTQQLEEDEIKSAVNECLAWFYNKYNRIKPAIENKE